MVQKLCVRRRRHPRKDFPMKTKNPPVIRRGQRHPYVKGKREQIDQRRGFVARILDEGATKTEIHRAVRQQFNIEWRQCDRYLAFVTGNGTGTNTRLARGRTERSQTPQDAYYQKLIEIYQDAGKQ
jgi:ribosomal protein L23